jgi:hypothetical protein
MLALGDEVEFHDGVQSKGVDDLTGSFGEDDAHPGLERVVCEQSHVVGTLPTLGQFSKDQEPLEASAFATHPYTLQANCQWVEITFCNSALFDDTHGSDPSVDQEDEGQYDAASEDPSRDVERDGRLDLARPFVEYK